MLCGGWEAGLPQGLRISGKGRARPFWRARFDICGRFLPQVYHYSQIIYTRITTKRAKRVTIYNMERTTQKCIGLLALILILSLTQPAMALPQGILEMGDYGSQVAELQQELSSLGFYQGEISGTFSTDTRDALIALQKVLGVETDGAYGPETAGAYAAALEDGSLTKPISTPEAAAPLQGKVIGIDPGHQTDEDTNLEPLLPDSERTKPRMTKGAVGVKTGVAECQVNLAVGLKLKAMLEEGGASVVMTRTTNDVNISNIERAQIMNQNGVDCWVRLHCDASSSERVNGAHGLIPSRAYNADIYADSLRLAKQVMASFCAATGAADGGITALMDQTGFNWSDSPVVAVEMGYLSNAEDDVRLGLDSYQIACATGIYNGIVSYFQQN